MQKQLQVRRVPHEQGVLVCTLKHGELLYHIIAVPIIKALVGNETSFTHLYQIQLNDPKETWNDGRQGRLAEVVEGHRLCCAMNR